MNKWTLINFATGEVLEASERMSKNEVMDLLLHKNLDEYTWFQSMQEYTDLRDGKIKREFKVNYKDTSFTVYSHMRSDSLFCCYNSSFSLTKEGLTNSIQNFGEYQIDLRNRLRGTK